MTPAALLLAAFALAGLAITTLPVVLLARFRRNQSPFLGGPRRRADRTSSPPVASTAEGRPRLSILKPLRGLDDGLEENLASFASLRGVDYEVVLSVADPGDPALEVVAGVRSRFPEAPFVLVVGGAPEGRIGNPKVERLVAAARVARGDLFLVSDSNVRVAPDDVARTVALFDDPSVGCVSNLFVGEGARDLGAVVERLHLLTFVVPGNVLAAWNGTPCVVGKSMALPRRVHDAIGGFAAFGDVLAEDQAIGLAVRDAGFRVVLSPVVVSNVIERRTLGRALDRQVRWGKIRYAFSRPLFAGELLMNPFPVALLAAVLAVPGGSPWAGPLFRLALLALLLRVLQASLLGRICGAPLRLADLVVLPLKDVLQLGTQAIPLLSREVVWHGHRARIGKGTVLVEVERPSPALHGLPPPASRLLHDPRGDSRARMSASGTPLVVFLHGLSARPSDLDGVLGRLPSRFEALVASLPLRRSGTASVESLVDALAGELAGEERPLVLVGGAVGAQIALLFARRHRDRVRGLVLSGCPETVERGLEPGVPLDLPTALGDVRVPTLLLWGAEDRVTPPDVARRLRDLLPDARLLFVLDAGQAPMVDSPSVFAFHLSSFLNDLAPESRPPRRLLEEAA